MFTLTTAYDIRRVAIVLTGFWDAGTMLKFEGEIIAALSSLKAIGGAKACLVDASLYPVQSPEITARHQHLLASLGDLAAERIAMVVPGQLVRRQAGRAAGVMQHQMFGSREEALQWLDG